MFRMTTALAAAAIVCSAATADESRIVKAELSFDHAKLTTEAGAVETLASLERQAKTACRTVSMVSMGFSYDAQCVETMVADAVEKIGSDTLRQQFAALESADS